MSIRNTTAAALLRRHLGVLKIGTGALAIAVASSFAVPAAAQQTSSSLTGLVLLPTGEPASGASVEILHVPSGTRSTATVNAEGRFNATGLRVGGPYNVTFRAPNIQAQVVEGVFVRLGQPFALDLVLDAGQADSIEEIVVTGERIASTLAGAGSQFNIRDIERAPTVNRDIKDVIRVDPRIAIGRNGSNEVNIAGSNSRFNSFTVDGIRQGDDFGLNYNGYPTQRTPISLDAVAAVSVNIAPYDVEYSGFQGGNINVVTKSGSNDFSGSAYYYYTDDSLSGDKSKGDDVNLTFDEQTYGATLGGPIIQDKLFFFAQYEKFEETSPVQYGPQGSGAGVQTSDVTLAQFQEVLAITRNVYGFEPLELQNTLKEEDEKILAKIDWNINEDHRASFTYQRTEGNEVAQRNAFASGSGDNVSAPSSWYNRGITLEQYSGQLFSQWTSDFSTELKIGRKEVVTRQDPLGGGDFMSARVDVGDGYVWVGPDISRHANYLTNDLNQYKLKGQYLLGDHTLTGGWEREELEVFNLFIQYTEGEYQFTSVDNYRNRLASRLVYQNAITNNENDGAADFGFEVDSFYVQDKWNATADLELTFGLRYETYTMGDEPALNPNFVNRNGFANTKMLDGEELWLPRFGFNYQLDDRTTIRGGVGAFGGGTPNVWISNNYSNDGVRFDRVTISRPNSGPLSALQAAALNNVDGFDIPLLVQQQLEAANGEVNALSPDFDLPYSWRYSLAVDREFDFGMLGDGWNFTAEAIYTDLENALYYQDLRLTQIGTAPDGRPIYQDNRLPTNQGGLGSDFVRDLVLFNSDKGSTLVLSTALDKDFETEFGDISLTVGYAYTDAEEVNPGYHSTASTGFGGYATFDPNGAVAATSDSEIKHRFTWQTSWSKEFFTDFITTATLFGEHKSGRPFSYVFANDADNGNADVRIWGDSSTGGRQLVYVPTGPDDPRVNFADPSSVSYEELAALLRETGLDEYAGQIAPRYGFTNDWQHTVDFQLKQQIPTFFEGHRAVLQLDIFNLTNLLNNDWGRVDEYFDETWAYETRLVNDQYVITDVESPSAELQDGGRPSVWRIQVGVRYEF